MIVHHRNPTVQIPSWNTLDDPPVNGLVDSPSYEAALAALHRFLPRNDQVNDDAADADNDDDEPLDSYSCDDFRMYEFKVRRCNRGRSHDWTECPYAHPGEKARRRDPRKYSYSGTACPEFRKGSCKRGDACEFSHGVFECWLHPSRYRTQPCKDGTACRRRVCFFAHTPEQLRVLSPSSPKLRASSLSVFDSYDGAPESPPVSPSVKGMQRATMNDLVTSLRQMQLSKVNSAPNSWKAGIQLGNGCFGSPRAAGFMAGFGSLPGTPTRADNIAGLWDVGFGEEDEVVERVESGRALRAKLVEKLCKENAIEKPSCSSQAPDVAWVSELVNDEIYGGNIFSW